ncbi:MAG: thioredoxin [Anaerolineaceae bacterium 4572_78]|nr:MAG: thioredoxin [Anaerolineaceae bacterium 4572_78]
MAVEHLTKATFKEKIFDFEKEKEWKYKGENPCIIDFYADWCGPCKIIAPILEELSKEYCCNVDFYKVDTQREQELAGMFNIMSIPAVLFIPLSETPQMSVGALPKDTFKQLIKEIFNVEKK